MFSAVSHLLSIMSVSNRGFCLFACFVLLFSVCFRYKACCHFVTDS